MDFIKENLQLPNLLVDMEVPGIPRLVLELRFNAVKPRFRRLVDAEERL